MKNWEILNSRDRTAINSVIEEWNELLSKNLSEHKYQKFISSHAGLFFGDVDVFIVINKMKFSIEKEWDFVIVRDGYSRGTIYEFIEIKRPQDRLFNKNGIPSKALQIAIDQTIARRDWLKTEKKYFQKYLPTTNTRVVSDSNLKFKIIIGRSENIPTLLEKRSLYMSELGIEIRSFDYLSSLVSNRLFFNWALLHYVAGTEKISPTKLNQLANPFFKAVTDSQWRSFCEKRIPTFHLYSRIIDEVIALRTYNKLQDKIRTLR